jgi:hypothetical protein
MNEFFDPYTQGAREGFATGVIVGIFVGLAIMGVITVLIYEV